MATWLSQQITAARLAAGISAGEVANAAGLERTTYTSIESGKSKNPSFDSVVRIARALGMDIAALASQVESSASDEAVDDLRTQRDLRALKEHLQRALAMIDDLAPQSERS